MVIFAYKINIKACIFLHVAFGRNVTVIAIATQGRDSARFSQWVTSYTLSVSNDGSKWRPYTQDTAIRVRKMIKYDLIDENI